MRQPRPLWRKPAPAAGAEIKSPGSYRQKHARASDPDTTEPLFVIRPEQYGRTRRGLYARMPETKRNRSLFSAASAEMVRLPGSDDHAQVPAFQSRTLFDDSLGFDFQGDSLEHFHTNGGMRYLPSPEYHRNFDLVAFLEKFPDVLELELEIMLFDLGPDLYFLHLDRGLALFRLPAIVCSAGICTCRNP